MAASKASLSNTGVSVWFRFRSLGFGLRVPGLLVLLFCSAGRTACMVVTFKLLATVGSLFFPSSVM